MNLDELRARRDFNYHRTPERRVHDMRDALRFINEVGFCFLFSSEGSEAPTLYEAIIGARQDWTTEHDAATGRCWGWKDDLPIEHKCFYGKLLRNKPVLISLELFPYFYAASGNYGDLDQYLEEYHDGKISLAAKQIYEALLYHGAMPTSELRRASNLPGKKNARDFERGLVELQMGLKITKTGISDSNRWHYCYIYDLLPRWLPDEVQRGLAIKTLDACPIILRRYLRNVVVSSTAEIARLFGWSAQTIEHSMAALTAAGELQPDIRVDGLEGVWLGLTQA